MPHRIVYDLNNGAYSQPINNPPADEPADGPLDELADGPLDGPLEAGYLVPLALASLSLNTQSHSDNDSNGIINPTYPTPEEEAVLNYALSEQFLYHDSRPEHERFRLFKKAAACTTYQEHAELHWVIVQNRRYVICPVLYREILDSFVFSFVGLEKRLDMCLEWLAGRQWAIMRDIRTLRDVRGMIIEAKEELERERPEASGDGEM